MYWNNYRPRHIRLFQNGNKIELDELAIGFPPRIDKNILMAGVYQYVYSEKDISNAKPDILRKNTIYIGQAGHTRGLTKRQSDFASVLLNPLNTKTKNSDHARVFYSIHEGLSKIQHIWVVYYPMGFDEKATTTSKIRELEWQDAYEAKWGKKPKLHADPSNIVMVMRYYNLMDETEKERFSPGLVKVIQACNKFTGSEFGYSTVYKKRATLSKFLK